MKDDIRFRPVTQDDLSLLMRWIAQPHWQEWWGDPDEEVNHIKDMLAGRDTTRPFIFQSDGDDLGYIQAWKPEDQLFEPWLSEAPWMVDLPKGSVGVDLSIGDASHLSKGLGTKTLKSFVAKLLSEGHQTITIDPDPLNKRAIKAYENVGFRVMPEFEGKTGDYLLMKYEGAQK